MNSHLIKEVGLFFHHFHLIIVSLPFYIKSTGFDLTRHGKGYQVYLSPFLGQREVLGVETV